MAIVVVSAAGTTPAFANAPINLWPRQITLLVPASKGGGWDLTAQAMKHALEANGLAQVKVRYSPGAGGLIGLAQLAAVDDSREPTLLIGGMFMIGAGVQNRAIVSLADTTPIARLSGEYDVIVVGAQSRYRSGKDLIARFRASPRELIWTGGSQGGPDQVMVWRIGEHLNVPPEDIRYHALPGGRDVGLFIGKRQLAVGISGYSEMAPQITSGELTALAVAADRPIPGTNIPTLKDLGIPLSMLNWRGVFAAPRLGAARQEQYRQLIAAMVESDEWQQHLARMYWQNLYLTGRPFETFIRQEYRRGGSAEMPLNPKPDLDEGLIGLSSQATYAILFVLLSMIGALTTLLFVQYRRSIWASINRKDPPLVADDVDTVDNAPGVAEVVEQEMAQWHLTEAEKDVARLLLKGLRLKEIAGIRGTSERTVRQQAAVIYRKAGVVGRSELAAYFYEDFLNANGVQHHMGARILATS